MTTHHPLDTAISLLADVHRRATSTHDRAWWPGTGVQHSRVGANTSRAHSPLLQVGDGPSLARYRIFMADLAVLRDVVGELVEFKPRSRLTETTHPTHVGLVVVEVIDLLRWAKIHRSASEDQVREIVGRSSRLSGHQEAILSRPRVPVSVPCRNAGERERCTGWATNRKQELCRSCENAQDHIRRRTRKRNPARL